MYYEDLTGYKYEVSEGFSLFIYLKNLVLYKLASRKILNVGWLDSKHEFHQKKGSELFLDLLFQLCSSPVKITRGYHMCPFCKKKYGVEVERKGKKMILGSAEIRVKGPGGKIYAAPNLIYHYVEAHDYSPPEEFVNAVLLSKGPTRISVWLFRLRAKND